MTELDRKPNHEIERKFLVRSLPEKLGVFAQSEIEQGYLAIAPGGVQVRLRKKNNALSLTFKRGVGNAREEREIELTPEQFAVLWPATHGRRLSKTRYDIPFRDRIVEIDIYHGRHEGLIVAEVEFADEKSCAAFERPDWLGDDVTGDPRYSNQLLAS